MDGTDTLAGKTVGSYRLLHLLGSGGMGAVYRGVQLAMNREVAIKVLKPANKVSEKVIKRFRREAYLTSRLEHPNTVNTIDFGEDDGLLYLVLQLLRGKPLSGVLKHQAPLAPRRVARMGRQVCLSLAEAHGLGIVHRDLKPDNIFVCDYEGKPDFIKVVDFGIARIIGGDQPTKLTASGAIIGTPKYMAPEQVVSGDITPATDLYALGVMLYEMLCGSAPFRAESVMSLAFKQVHDQPEPLPGTLDVAWRSLVERLMAKDPRARPESARAVANVLERLELGLPVDLTTTDSWEAPLEPEPGEPRRTVECAPPATDDQAAADLAAAADAYASLVPIQTVGASATVDAPTASRSKRALWAAGLGAGAALLVVLGVLVFQSGGPGGQVEPPSARIAIDAPPFEEQRSAAASPDVAASHSETESPLERADIATSPDVVPSEPPDDVVPSEASEETSSPQPAHPAHLELTTKPSGATVLRGGNVLCTTPCDLDVPAAEAVEETLVVRLRGHLTEEVLVLLEPKAQVVEHLTLRTRKKKRARSKPDAKKLTASKELQPPPGPQSQLPSVDLPGERPRPKRELPTVNLTEEPPK